MQVTDPGRRNLGGNVNMRNLNLAMVNPVSFARRKSGGMLKRRATCSWHMCKARSCLVSCSLARWILTVTLCRLRMQPSQLTMNSLAVRVFTLAVPCEHNKGN